MHRQRLGPLSASTSTIPNRSCRTRAWGFPVFDDRNRVAVLAQGGSGIVGADWELRFKVANVAADVSCGSPTRRGASARSSCPDGRADARAGWPALSRPASWVNRPPGLSRARPLVAFTAHEPQPSTFAARGCNDRERHPLIDDLFSTPRQRHRRTRTAPAGLWLVRALKVEVKSTDYEVMTEPDCVARSASRRQLRRCDGRG